MGKRAITAGVRPWLRAPGGRWQIKGRLWLEKYGETYLSWGRVVLLERIREADSIAAAARSRNGDSHAWSLVAAMNRLAGSELVGRRFGGRQGRPGLAHPGGRGGGDQVLAPGGGFPGWLASRHDL